MRFDDALVVDDEAASRAVLRHVLEVGGLEVSEAADGRRGLALARERAPDLVVTDIRMPGLSGTEMAARIRKDPSLAHAALVAVTRHPEDARNGGDDSLFDLVLRKPVAVQRFWRWLQSGG